MNTQHKRARNPFYTSYTCTYICFRTRMFSIANFQRMCYWKLINRIARILLFEFGKISMYFFPKQHQNLIQEFIRFDTHLQRSHVSAPCVHVLFRLANSEVPKARTSNYYGNGHPLFSLSISFSHTHIAPTIISVD